MANIICFKQEKGLKNCSNRQLKVTAKHKIYPDGQKKRASRKSKGGGTLSDVLLNGLYENNKNLIWLWFKGG